MKYLIKYVKYVSSDSLRLDVFALSDLCCILFVSSRWTKCHFCHLTSSLYRSCSSNVRMDLHRLLKKAEKQSIWWLGKAKLNPLEIRFWTKYHHSSILGGGVKLLPHSSLILSVFSRWKVWQTDASSISPLFIFTSLAAGKYSTRARNRSARRGRSRFCPIFPSVRPLR